MWAAAIDDVRVRGDSCGGDVTCVIRSCPKGLGSPVFDKLEAELCKAFMSLPASKVRCVPSLPLSHVMLTQLLSGLSSVQRHF